MPNGGTTTCNENWATGTCPLTWGTQGVWQNGMDDSDINAVTRTREPIIEDIQL